MKPHCISRVLTLVERVPDRSSSDLLPKSYLLLALLLACWNYSPSFATGQSVDVHAEFTLASGFSMEPVASAPLTKWPTLVDWDSAGNLLVVESGGVAHPIQEHNQKALHRLVRLIDDDGDGKFDRRQLVADQLPFTEGVLCLGSRILVTSPPVIYELSDRDGDGHCEQREVWFDGQTITGCANDLHGPYLGRDGWIYWCKGAFAQQKHPTLDGGTLSDKAAHIHRRKITGGPIEPVMSGGMDNPVGFAMLPNGERFFSSTFLVHPGDGYRDGVVHAIYGGAYGKDHSALEGVVRTGELMPIMTHLGPAAPSGLICLRSGMVDSHDTNTLVAALFNHRKVIALPVSSSGASYRAEPVELVVGNRIDFHPTDVIEDFDGSLLVVDTGGWYDLCCPSSRVDQELAAGGIYRLKRVSNSTQPAQATMRRTVEVGQDMSASQVASLLDDVRPWVARAALLRIATSGDWALSELADRLHDSRRSLSSRRNALWAMGAIGSDSALEFASGLLAGAHQVGPGGPAGPVEAAVPVEPGAKGDVAKNDGSTRVVDPIGLRSAVGEELQHIACHLVALHRFNPAKQHLERILSAFAEEAPSPEHPVSPSLARVAAEAIGRIGDAGSVKLLFPGFERTRGDRSLDHSFRYALYEIGKADSIAAFLDSPNAMQRELALSTLDLRKAESWLTAERLVSAAQQEETRLTSTRLIVKRPHLASSILAVLGPAWASSVTHEPPTELFRELCREWSNQGEMDRWVASTFSESLRSQQQAGNSINDFTWQWVECILNAKSGLPVPVVWHGWMLNLLDASPERMAHSMAGLNLDASEQLPLVESLTVRIAKERDPSVRQKLLLCLPAQHLYSDDAWTASLIRGLLEAPMTTGSTPSAWALLDRLKISEQNARELLQVLPDLPSLELLKAIEIIAAVELEELDRQMLTALAENRAARGLPSGSLVSVFRKRSNALRALAEKVAGDLSQSDPDVKRQIQAMLNSLPPGDAVRGLSLYHSPKVNCAGCHQMGYLGGKIGPELTRIGGSRTREALLEAILFPNQRIEQGFQSTQVLTVDGRVIHGIPTSNSSEQIIELRVSADRLERVDLQEIEQTRPSEISIMPGGMLELLSQQELADLLSLLEAAK